MDAVDAGVLHLASNRLRDVRSSESVQQDPPSCLLDASTSRKTNVCVTEGKRVVTYATLDLPPPASGSFPSGSIYRPVRAARTTATGVRRSRATSFEKDH